MPGFAANNLIRNIEALGSKTGKISRAYLRTDDVTGVLETVVKLVVAGTVGPGE